MKKFLEQLQNYMMVIWFFSAVYLSINYLIGYFIDTNPYIFKTIFVISFLGSASLMVRQGINNSTKNNNNSRNLINFGGCKNCKNK